MIVSQSYSLSLTFFFVSVLPFDDASTPALFRKIVKGEYSYPDWLSADARSLIDNMLVLDPTRRFTCEQIKQHPWYMKGSMASTPKHSGLSVSHEAFLAVPEPEDSGPSLGSGPLTLNAFDIVNMICSASIPRLFQSPKASTKPSTPHSLQHSSQFMTSLPLSEIMDRTGDILAFMKAAIKIHDKLCKVNKRSWCVL
jgi:serine/threonine protein kinase